MSVSARFYVRSVEKYAAQAQKGWAPPAPVINVKLSPVSGGRGEQNKAWASATPSGEVTLTIGNAGAAAWFEERLGKDVAITFEDRDPAELDQ